MYFLNLKQDQRITKNWIIPFLLIIINRTYGQSHIFFDNDERCESNMPEFCHCVFRTLTCDCAGQNFILEGPMARNRNNITISNCGNLSIAQKSLYDSAPLTITLKNIKDLHFYPSSFEMDVFQDPRITLSLINTNINSLPRYAFSSSVIPESRVLTGIDFSNPKTPMLKLLVESTTINVIEAGAFGNFTIDSMSIVDSTVNSAQRFAINNKLMKTLQIVNTTFNKLAKHAIVLNHLDTSAKLLIKGNSFPENLPQFLSGTINGDVYITNNNFSTLQESPWNLRILNDAVVANNTFKVIPKYGMHLSVNNRVAVSNNLIHRLQANALQLIIPEEQKTTLILSGNVIEDHEPMSLCLNDRFEGDHVLIKGNVFQQQCFCNITDNIAKGLGYGNLTIELLYEDKVHQQWLQHGMCIYEESEFAIDLFLVKQCLQNKRLTMVLLLIFAALLITITLCVICAWRRIKYRNFMQNNDSNYQSFSAPAPSSQGHTPWSLVQPDTRTYQETEIHVLFDKAKEIEDTYDSDPEKENFGISDTCAKGRSNPIMSDASNVDTHDQCAELNGEKDIAKPNKHSGASWVRKSCPVIP